MVPQKTGGQSSSHITPRSGLNTNRTKTTRVSSSMSHRELIELQDLSPGDRIELAPSHRPAGPQKPPERRSPHHMVRLVGDTVRFDVSFWEPFRRGEGHDFQVCGHSHLAWCDLCGEFIWGVYRRSLRCVNCRYTCHPRCRPLIQLDCEAVLGQSDCSKDFETDTDVDTEVDWRKQQQLSVTELQHKVKEYNAQINSNLYMSLNRDGSYTGFIKVQFQLARPVSLPPAQRLSSALCSSSSSSFFCSSFSSLPSHGLCTSFYLPRDTAKQLHVGSSTRVREVIEALLNKFTVVDNPAKFALFERSERNGQVYMRKLCDDERPLFLRLCAGPSENTLSFILRENESGEVNWDAFSLPELSNFLRILQREEEEHVRQILQRYSVARDKLKEALRSFSSPG
ncbi:ras association domain-containing protein 1 isoform X2 [Hemibagrus wyckioides]|uniref:ras association domain-containing protein 1 isoform X2 n=1 Tax=Hemibagrus wyckioides TaxID=337641 RepID=UPI00266DC6B7|nr:ras association domain-containing protein 1 isoform X2 [Hemibagrus wyckioides]